MCRNDAGNELMTIWRIAACIPLFVLCLGAPALHAETIRIVGEPLAVELAINPAVAPFTEATRINTTVTETTLLTAMETMDRGGADVVVSTESLNSVINTAIKEKIDIRNRALMQQFILLPEISYAVVVNPDNKVEELSVKQLANIFTGATNNWSDLNGDNLPIAVVWGKPNSGGGMALKNVVLKDKPLAAKVVKVPDAAAVRAAIAINPAAIGIIPVALVDPAVKQVTAPALKMPAVTLITVGFPSAKVLNLINFLKGPGRSNILD